MKKITIGEAARQSGVKVPTIRYYEGIGLLRAPSRSDGNQRSYEPSDLKRLIFIRHARELGFEVEQRIRSLMALKVELEIMVEGCGHGRVDQCRVIEVLADHGECMHPQH